ncbi:MAG: hypothetical protein AAFV93_18075 [Chloroflexota bacterium]
MSSASGVVSYFEWVQDLQAYFWDKQNIFGQLDRILKDAYKRTKATSEAKNIDLRTAAQVTAIQHVAEAITTRGIYP